MGIYQACKEDNEGIRTLFSIKGKHRRDYGMIKLDNKKGWIV